MSQNLMNYMSFTEDTVVRINLAWVENLDDFEKTVSNLDNKIFVDLPIGRTKPPNNTYSINDLYDIFKRNKNIKYLAISNVESSKDLNLYEKLFSYGISLVPKIETKKGVENISKICAFLEGEKTIMLDHDDLFSDLIRNSISPKYFFDYIKKLESFCENNSIKLLKTRGVIFSDFDRYVY